jgi:hypothetical protein
MQVDLSYAEVERENPRLTSVLVCVVICKLNGRTQGLHHPLLHTTLLVSPPHVCTDKEVHEPQGFSPCVIPIHSLQYRASLASSTQTKPHYDLRSSYS